jgi:hypothetical protein
MKLKHRREDQPAVHRIPQGSSSSCSNVSEKFISDVNFSVEPSIPMITRLDSSASQLSGTSIISPLLFLTSLVLSFLLDDGSGNSVVDVRVVIASLRRCLCSRTSMSMVRCAMT